MKKSAFFLSTSIITLGFISISEARAQACPGTESRQVVCRDFRGNAVDDSYCDKVGVKPVTTRTCPAQCPPSGDGGGDPLIFDLDGNGVSLLSVDDGVMFDIDNDGKLDQTGWVDKGDGMLALDENGNGIIDNQSELFGDIKSAAYKHLAEYDSNEDGKITRRDNVWKHLRMWIDKNSNGKTDPGELKTMKDLGMTKIDLNYKTVEEVSNGNDVTGRGKFTRYIKGVGRVVSDVVEAFFDFISDVT